MEINNYKEKFKQNRDTMFIEFGAIRKKDMTQKAATLNPGQKMPFGQYSGGFHYEDSLKMAEDCLLKYRQNAESIINDFSKELSGFMAITPTEETTRALQNMQLVKEPTEDYINAMVEKHGDNFTALKIISQYARDNKINITKVPTEIVEHEKAYNTLENMKREIMDYQPSRIDNLSPGRIAFVDCMTE